jgi:hypothetical protein
VSDLNYKAPSGKKAEGEVSTERSVMGGDLFCVDW